MKWRHCEARRFN